MKIFSQVCISGIYLEVRSLCIMASSKSLEEEATEAILAEARRMRSMENEFGSSAWVPKPLAKKPNKRFVRNVIHHSIQHNARRKTDFHQTHSKSPHEASKSVGERHDAKKCSHKNHGHCSSIENKKSLLSNSSRSIQSRLSKRKRHHSKDKNPDMQKHMKLSEKT